MLASAADRGVGPTNGRGLTGAKSGRIAAQGGRMRTFNIVVERDSDTGLYVGHVPGWLGAHSQGATLDELHQNLREVVEMLLEDG